MEPKRVVISVIVNGRAGGEVALQKRRDYDSSIPWEVSIVGGVGEAARDLLRDACDELKTEALRTMIAG